MKTWIWRLFFAAVFFAFVVAALLLRDDNGLAILRYGEWQVKTSLVLLLAAFAALLFVLWLIAALLSSIFHAPGKLRAVAEKRTAERAKREIEQGMIAMGDGNWKRAERRFLGHVSDSPAPLVNYLLAARAAQLQNADERRDHYLSLAQANGADEAEPIVRLTQAELQLREGQHGQALATLEQLLEDRPKHPEALRLLHRLHRDAGDWAKLEALLPDLRAANALPESELDQLEVDLHTELLTRANPESDKSEAAREEIAELWKQVPARLKNSLPLLRVYALQLHRAGADDSAASMIESTLKRSWDESLAGLYGLLKIDAVQRQLATAEGWLKQHGDSAVLLLTLGRLAMRNKLWGKARSYLEASVACGPRPDSYQELGLLLTSMDEQDAAAQAFRHGLAHGLRQDPARLMALPTPADVKPKPEPLPASTPSGAIV